MYVRIGTEYYKKGQIPLHSGDTCNVLLKWRKSEIVTDEGKDYLNDIMKYDGFCLIPSHTNYEQVIKNFYNKYENLEHKMIAGEFPAIKRFLKHIFGTQFDLGLDYLTILWQYPTQILPILCLVSNERKTGKTTFLNFLKLIFQGNMTINKNEDFRSRFNSDWSSKLIVAVDEVLLDKKEDSERIKNLSTSLSYKTESKGIDKVESYFFGKFILCSNNEENFIQIDNNEIRYWVLKIPGLTDDKENPDLLYQLEKELPCFMFFLNKRKIKHPKKTRMWFKKEQIYTPALGKLVKGNKTYLNKEIEELLIDDFIKFDVDVLKFSLADLNEMLSRSNVRASNSRISEVLKSHFNLVSTNGSYSKYYLNLNTSGNYSVSETKHKGRYYSFNRADFISEQ
ncbi:primase-helicase family protein [Algibacter mikhailovii]|uniref:primase-helicase family protein n=1 Tax=Algibacter mikhailovii TaxID=425498 RepID=UPI0024955565|nr:primase-helicase family protein [Algibacter mikhailovii]